MSEIKPALTAEEWAVWLKDGARVPEMVDACYTAVFGGRIKDGSRHAQAAVALHGQPFGFSKKDVEQLRAIGDGWPVTHVDWNAGYDTDAGLEAAALSLAGRIEALLPPEEK